LPSTNALAYSASSNEAKKEGFYRSDNLCQSQN
jgi:hypothetical protein